MTLVRVNGIKSGYWTTANKEEVVQRLGDYEDFGLTPKQMEYLFDHFITPNMVKEAKDACD